MATRGTRQILRYRAGQRVVHWVLAVSFLLLLATGLMLLWPALSSLAAGGLSRTLQLVGALLFLSVPVLYLILDRHGLKETIIESFTYDRDDWEWLVRSPRYFLGRASGMPPQGRLNAGQKLHHAGIVLTFFTVSGSGLVMWLGKGSLGPTGLAAAAIVHDLSMLAMTVLLVGHIYFTFVYGALSGMISGYIPETSARLEHSKWVSTLPQQAPWVVNTATDSRTAERTTAQDEALSTAGGAD
jgi:formate dehydrogenase subunit gamma